MHGMSAVAPVLKPFLWAVVQATGSNINTRNIFYRQVPLDHRAGGDR